MKNSEQSFLILSQKTQAFNFYLLGLTHLKYNIKRNRRLGQLYFLDSYKFNAIYFSVQLRKFYIEKNNGEMKSVN